METESIRIRITDENENLEAYKSWLPQAFLSVPHPAFFLAERESDGKAVGLGSLRLLGKEEKKAGRFQIYVLPEYRRKGTGTSLMQSIYDYASNVKAHKLLAGVPVADESEDKQFFESLDGYGIKRTLYVYAMKIDVAWDYLDRVVKRLMKARGGIPDGYEIISLKKANRKNVFKFVMKYLGGIPEALKRRLSGGENGFLPKLSRVIRNKKGLQAVLLVRKSKKGLVVESRVVAPEARGTWVNVALMYSFVQKVKPLGVKEVYFEGDDQLHEDTMKLARRGACEILETNRLYGCEVIDNSIVE